MKKGGDSRGKGGDDDGVWRVVTRTVKAYPAAGRPVRKASPAPVKKPPTKTSVTFRTPARPSACVEEMPRGFDRATETKLKRGQLPLEGRIDLHGMTQEAAFNALHRFLLRAIADEKRTVLVITGKGVRSEGVLKRMLPLWLEDIALKKHILALSPASPKDGGAGAFYIRLRKPKRS